MSKEIVYTYHIDLNERGEFRAHIENTRGNTVYSIEYPIQICVNCNHNADSCECEPGQEEIFQDSSLIDLGYMKHWRDVYGLRDYLVMVGLMRNSYELEFRN